MPPILFPRFWNKVALGAPNECWMWTGAKTKSGYGHIYYKGKRVAATHLSLAIDGRARPSGLMALHSCDNPTCVNPAHLRWGTALENMQDRSARGRVRNGIRRNRKLTPEMIAEILSLRETSTVLGLRFGVSSGRISKVRIMNGCRSKPGPAPSRGGSNYRRVSA